MDPPWLVLELCKEGGLDKLLRERRAAGRGPLPVPVAASVGKQVALALLALHATQPKAILHCDLKAANVLLVDTTVAASEVSGARVKVGDFGLSLVKHASRSAAGGAGGAGGTYTHMAPEVISEKYAESFGWTSGPSPASDVYALGILLWELLTGEEPFADKEVAQIIHLVVIEKRRPDWPPELSCPHELTALVAKCWAANPADRPSARAVVDVLALFAATEPSPGQADAVRMRKLVNCAGRRP